MGKNIAIIILSVVVAALGAILLMSRKCIIGSMTNIANGQIPQYIENDNGVVIPNVGNVKKTAAGYLECNCDDGTTRLCLANNNAGGCGQCCGREIRK